MPYNVNPIPTFPVSLIVPTVYRDSESYLDILEALSDELTSLLEQISEHTIENDAKLLAAVNAAIVEINAMSVTLLTEMAALDKSVDDRLVAQDEKVSDQLAENIRLVNEAIQQVINSSIEVNDLVVETLLNKPNSKTINALEQVAVISLNGRKGKVTLTPTDVGANRTISANTIPQRDANGSLPGIANPVAVSDAANKGYVDGSDKGIRDSVDALDRKIGANYNIDWAAVAPLLRMPSGTRLNLPTHVSPTGGEATHPSVVKFAEPWNGFSYWMAMTPYPGGNDAHEDPNILASNDGMEWVVPPGFVNPLDDASGSPTYNSDTDLVFAQGKLWCFWRFYNSGGGGASENIYVRTTTDGRTWTDKQLVYQSNQATRRLVSPSFIYENNRWWMYAVDIAPANNSVVRLQSNGTLPLNGQWGSPTICAVRSAPNRQPWHIEVRKFDGVYILMLNDCLMNTSGTGGNLYVQSSRNGTTFTGGAYRLTAQVGEGYNTLYRATFLPEIIGGILYLRVWYGAWQQGTPPGFNIYHSLAIPSANVNEMFAEARGIVDPGSTAANGVRSVVVKFPEGRFTVAPNVVISLADGERFLNAAAGSATPEQFVAYIGSTATTALAAGARWHATQATQGNGNG